MDPIGDDTRSFHHGGLNLSDVAPSHYAVPSQAQGKKVQMLCLRLHLGLLPMPNS